MTKLWRTGQPKSHQQRDSLIQSSTLEHEEKRKEEKLDYWIVYVNLRG